MMDIKRSTSKVIPSASVMGWNKWFFYAYCVFVLSAPGGNSVYSVLVRSITYLLSFPQFHFFRAFVWSGSPASKTVIHGLVNTFTYYTQLYITNEFALVLFGCFQESATELLQAYPQGFCVIAIPITLKPVLITLMFLAIFKLLVTIKFESFLNLNHETILNVINIVIGIIWAGIVTGELILRGTLCNPNLATTYTNHIIGIQVADKYFENKTKATPYFPLISPFIMMIGVFCYVSSLIIKKIQDLRKKQSTRRVQPIVVFKASRDRESLHENDDPMHPQSGLGDVNQTDGTQLGTLPQITFVRPVGSDARPAATGENWALSSLPLPLSAVVEPLTIGGKDVPDLESSKEKTKAVVEDEIHGKNAETTAVETLGEDQPWKANNDLVPGLKIAIPLTSGSKSLVDTNNAALTLQENFSLGDEQNLPAPSTASSIPSPTVADSTQVEESAQTPGGNPLQNQKRKVSKMPFTFLVMIAIIIFTYIVKIKHC